MEEYRLRKISLLCALGGIAGLFFLSQWLEVPPTHIRSIRPESIGKVVKVCGKISKKHVSLSNHIFLKLSDQSGSIDVVIFNQTARQSDYELKEKQRICITGRIEEYHGKLELLPVKPIQVA